MSSYLSTINFPHSPSSASLLGQSFDLTQRLDVITMDLRQKRKKCRRGVKWTDQSFSNQVCDFHDSLSWRDMK
jgi:hypothetical protein